MPSETTGSWSQVTAGEDEAEFEMYLKKTFDAGVAQEWRTDMGEFSFSVERNYKGYVNKIGARLGASGKITNYDDLIGVRQDVGYFSMIDTDDGKELQLGQKMAS